MYIYIYISSSDSVAYEPLPNVNSHLGTTTSVLRVAKANVEANPRWN